VNTSRRLLIATQLLLAIAYALPVLIIPDRLTGSDFLSFYTGWAIVRDGQGGRLYDLDLQRAYQAQVLAEEGSHSNFGLFPFINPPHAALATPRELERSYCSRSSDRSRSSSYRRQTIGIPFRLSFLCCY